MVTVVDYSLQLLAVLILPRPRSAIWPAKSSQARLVRYRER